MKIDKPGHVEFTMWGDEDIDFHIWGPFPTVTAAKDNCVDGFTEDNS